MGDHRAAELGDIPSDRGLIVELDGRRVGLFHVDGEVHAILSVCPHQGGPVGSGGVFPTTRATVERGRLVETLDHDTKVICCPWHGWEFDLRTGICTADASRRVVRYPARVEGEAVIVSLPDRGRGA